MASRRAHAKSATTTAAAATMTTTTTGKVMRTRRRREGAGACRASRNTIQARQAARRTHSTHVDTLAISGVVSMVRRAMRKERPAQGYHGDIEVAAVWVGLCYITDTSSPSLGPKFSKTAVIAAHALASREFMQELARLVTTDIAHMGHSRMILKPDTEPAGVHGTIGMSGPSVEYQKGRRPRWVEEG